MSAAFKAAAKRSWRPTRLRSDFSPTSPIPRSGGFTAAANEMRSDYPRSPTPRSEGFTAAGATTLRPSTTRRTRIALMNARSAKDEARRREHEDNLGTMSFWLTVVGALLLLQTGSWYTLRQHLNDRKKEAADLRQAMEDLKAETSVETGWFWRARTVVEDPKIEPIKHPIRGRPAKVPDQRTWLSRWFWKSPADGDGNFMGGVSVLVC